MKQDIQKSQYSSILITKKTIDSNLKKQEMLKELSQREPYTLKTSPTLPKKRISWSYLQRKSQMSK